MTDTLEDHKGTVTIGGRTITNLCFADDIDHDGSAREVQELVNLVDCFDKTSASCGMEISAEKTNNTNTEEFMRKDKN